MKNLKKREKIVIGIAAAVILYGIVDFIIPAKKNHLRDSVQNTRGIEEIVATLAAATTKGYEKETVRQIAAIREEKWKGDPFLDEDSYKKWLRVKEPAVPEKEKQPRVFVYSGYIDAGQKRLAVINDVEYQEGDSLEMNGFDKKSGVYKLKSIFPENVVIKNTTTGEKITLPLKDLIKGGHDGRNE
ncbi:MAG: hypothetical protein ACYDH8_04570 [Syntrophales bacterium]